MASIRDRMPKPTFHNLPEDKRQRILEAAIDEFATASFEAASVNRIVRAAGIAKGSFYQYFDGMLDLYRHLVLVELADREAAFMSAHQPPPELGLFGQIAHAALTGLRWSRDQPRLTAAARHVHQPVAPDSPLASLRDELRGLRLTGIRMMLEDGQRAGAVQAELDVDLAAALVNVMVQQGLDALLLQRCGVDTLGLCAAPDRAAEVTEAALQDAVTALVDLLQRGVGTGRDAGRLDLDGLRRRVIETRRD